MSRMVFFNVGWMRKYRGLSGDVIVGGGGYVREHGFGHEILNFLPHNGRMMGYVQPSGGYAINLGRLGATSDVASVRNVLVVWVARHPDGGSYVVGWYENATVHRREQPPPAGSGRNHKGAAVGFFAEASADDCVLLPEDDRVLQVPRGEKGAMGQSNVWFADDPSQESFRQAVLDLVHEGGATKGPRKKGKRGGQREPDPLERNRVEQAAIKTVASHFRSLGYSVVSKEADNVGWDLEATLGRRVLQLEVKGLSGNALSVELTPNEYQQMKDRKGSYRLCVVLNALRAPDLRIFSFCHESQTWEDEVGNPLRIHEITGARATCE